MSSTLQNNSGAGKSAGGAQKGLGKGLSALFSESYSTTATPESLSGTAAVSASALDGSIGGDGVSVRMIKVASLLANPFQPRQIFDGDKLQDLANSIKQNGIMQPIVAREQGDQYQIIAGERRFRAARMAGLSEIPVIISDIDDSKALELAIIENIQREDLTPIEEAEAYKRLAEQFQYSHEEVAKMVGKSRSHITNLLRLLSLPDSVKAMLNSGQITMGHARAVLSAENPEALAAQILYDNLNVRETERLALERSGRQPRQYAGRGGSANQGGANQGSGNQSGAERKAKTPINHDLSFIEESLSEYLGTTAKISMNPNQQSGSIQIKFNDLEELDGLLSRICGALA
jgi:ParB family chromosome partitioning protein